MAKRKTLAEEIADELFTDGTGAKGVELKLFDAEGLYRGGWSRHGVVGQVEKIIKARAKKPQRKVTR